jgi:hypothetical protein
MKLRTVGLLAAAVAGLLMFANASKAAGTSAISLATGNSLTAAKTVTDDTAGDSANPVLGAISWSTSIGQWDVVLTTGSTKNINGTATSPAMNLAIIASYNPDAVTPAVAGDNVLTIVFSDINFGPYTDGIISALSDTTFASDSEMAKVYTNGSNALMSVNAGGGVTNNTNLVTNLGPVTTITGLTTNGTIGSIGNPFSIGLVVTITAPSLHSGTENSSTASFVTAVPVPAAAWTGLSTLAGLAGLGLVRRRRTA